MVCSGMLSRFTDLDRAVRWLRPTDGDVHRVGASAARRSWAAPA